MKQQQQIEPRKDRLEETHVTLIFSVDDEVVEVSGLIGSEDLDKMTYVSEDHETMVEVVMRTRYLDSLAEAYDCKPLDIMEKILRDGMRSVEAQSPSPAP